MVVVPGVVVSGVVVIIYVHFNKADEQGFYNQKIRIF